MLPGLRRKRSDQSTDSSISSNIAHRYLQMLRKYLSARLNCVHRVSLCEDDHPDNGREIELLTFWRGTFTFTPQQ